MESTVSKELLFIFFSGQATPLQKRMIETWLDSPENRLLYYKWLADWEMERPQYDLDIEEPWNEFLERIDQVKRSESYYEAMPPRLAATRSKRWLAYAASIVLALATTFYFTHESLLYVTYSTAYGEVKHINLADGSKVVMNANSRLTLPRFAFGGNTRQIFLEGEAEFSVTHTHDDAKFLVQTPDNLEVEVLGTNFIVYTRQRHSKVVLNEGSVLLRNLKDTKQKVLSIKPGDVVVVKQGVFDVSEKQPVHVHAAWKDHDFVFDKTPFQEVVERMKETFGVSFRIDNSDLYARQLTGTIEADNIDDLIEALSKVLNVNITKNGNTVIFN